LLAWAWDGVLRGEADEAFAAAECCGEAEKGELFAGISSAAGAESAVAAQPREDPLDRPTPSTQPFAGHPQPKAALIYQHSAAGLAATVRKARAAARVEKKPDKPSDTNLARDR
jgi:hypothetical protein